MAATKAAHHGLSRRSRSWLIRSIAAAAAASVVACSGVTLFLAPVFQPNRLLGGQQQELHSESSTSSEPAGEGGAGGQIALAAVSGVGLLLSVKSATILQQRRCKKPASSASAIAKSSMSSSGWSFAAPTEMACALAGGDQSYTVVKAQSSSQSRSRTAMRWNLENFTEKSIKALMMAQQESRSLQQDTVDSEMMVVGIIAEGHDVGARVLDQLGGKLDKARAALIDTVGFGQGGRSVEMAFTPGAKQVLEEALESSREEGSAHVGTAHMLRAIVKQEDPHLEQFFIRLLGCPNMEIIRQKLLETLIKEMNAEREAAGDEPLLVKAEDLPLTETLKYAQDLSQAAAEGKLDPLIGREEQLSRTIRILGRRSKNNPVLVGEAGVGKTSIAHGLAQRIYEGKVPRNLKDKRVLQLDLAQLLAGTRYRGDFEERLRAVVSEVTNTNRRVILVIDEVHTLVGAGSGGGSEGGGIDAANLLKPALARGELQCIGATTYDEYRQYIEKDPALERRFQPVDVPEPSLEEAEAILAGLASKYERHHKLRYTPEALQAAVKLSAQYIADRNLPDKAIDVMDEAGSKVRQQLYEQAEQGQTLARRLTLDSELEEIRSKKKAAAAEERYELAQELKLRESQILEELTALQQDRKNATPEKLLKELEKLQCKVMEAALAEEYQEAQNWKQLEMQALTQLPDHMKLDGKAELFLHPRVTEEDIAQVVSTWTGIAVEAVSSTESAKLLKLEEDLQGKVIGQEEAVSVVSRALRRARAGLRNPDRPIASFIFAGPTGVGKTELCKQLSESFFGSADAMIRLDMSEYMEKHTVAKLIGAPPGYIGYSEGGMLTEAVRRKPYSLVLFDEVEKAHPDIFNLMLQMLDDGRLTDSKGRVVSFANTLVVMTTNLGSRSVQQTAAGGGLGFGTYEDAEQGSYGRVKDKAMDELKSFFRPEFLNRLDETVIFRPLTKQKVAKIAEIEFRKVLQRLDEQDFSIELAPRFKEKVVDEGFDPAYGARPLRRAMTRMLEDQLAEHLLENVEQDEEGKEEKKPKARRPKRKIRVDLDARGEVCLQYEAGPVEFAAASFSGERASGAHDKNLENSSQNNGEEEPSPV
mmetsp:Transcript_58375/g.139182  ORF Transcript_58375/g.139182 Transcript_58375/m.139182 type:complete len:1099 (+) Transcript_58375:195-3491(+)|eukprot:CAMPEP_0178399870 /NCGR_PEP_ID=MMETSP0689_2-20121128/15499_1 /TAXON_ID=160604 /ORGANISM="Amphidinium massartii, Strain CS-259" /LENGTH=1098 /DNA_ID=CAMNT_0020020653 /DNA_START=189 /DNA_END=3485 /DNA_ORIENTATION=-